MRQAVIEKAIQLVIAELRLDIDASGALIRLDLPPAHQQFRGSKTDTPHSETDLSLKIIVNDKNFPSDLFLAESLCKTEIFEIYKRTEGELVFYAPRQKPPRVITVDANFTNGSVIGPFSDSGLESIYPLEYTDIVFFSNWLAKLGDVILHASGVAVDGKGYCFAGKSGVGKSTMIDQFLNQKDFTILGEDQVILRYLRGRFWIFGTPWHIKPERCSPIGVPLDTLFFLSREDRNQVRTINESDGFKRLMASAFIPYYQPTYVEKIMKTFALLADSIPFKVLSYKIGADVLTMIK